jgi:hypothetical protein
MLTYVLIVRQKLKKKKTASKEQNWLGKILDPFKKGSKKTAAIKMLAFIITRYLFGKCDITYIKSAKSYCS